MNEISKKIQEVANAFNINGECTDISVIKTGHINNTYKVTYNNEGIITDYLFQKINTNVFKNPDKLMYNIIAVTKHLRNKIEKNNGDISREVLNFIPANDGKYYFYIEEGKEYWRICYFINNTYSCDIIENADVFYNSGAAFGKFQGLLADFPGETLYETIPDFHNTAKRFEALKKAISDNIAGRADSVKDEIKFALEREKDCSVLVNLIDEKKLPLRVTHNDTKLNNILFDNDTDIGICIVDLDTVMPGLSLYDFGDSIRFGANTAAEDEKDLSKVSLSLELYEKYVKGYLSSAGKSLTEKEIELLPFASKIMTYECGIRFLTDYLNGDTYFKTAYTEHNLDRCHTQFMLVADIERKINEMIRITSEAAKMI